MLSVHPESRCYDAASLVHEILAKTFPAPKKSQCTTLPLDTVSDLSLYLNKLDLIVALV